MMKKKQNLYVDGTAVIWCAVTAFLLLMLCSRSSFLYPCNDWNDANSYFTMGKAMMNGQVIYRDLYDQKGPYLYLLYGIAYLLSHDSFAGVFVLEILAITVFLGACYKILNLYCKRQTSFLLLPVIGAAVLSSKSFYFGGAAEEFCLPLLGISLYCSIKYFKERYPALPDVKMILANGVMAGIVMQVKYTMLGFYFAWMAMIGLAILFRKDLKGFIKNCAVFLLGMFVTLVPWLVYFGLNGALDDWYQCYIYNNVFLYSNFSEEGNGVFQRIYTLAKLLYWLILDNLSYFVLIIWGMGYFLLSLKIRWYEKINLLAMAGLLFLGIYVGGSTLPYYSIPFMAFAPLGAVAAGRTVEWTAGRLFAGKMKIKEKALKGGFLAVAVAVIGVSMAAAYGASMNSYFMAQDKDSYFLFKFRDIVKQEENPTLLNISCLDAGLYTVADILPTCRFFQTNGIAFQEMFREQEQYVREGRTQFILARDDYPEFIFENYELAGQEPYEWENIEFTYFLFRRKG
ncbi:MAG: hypothetical protein NC400_15205 [Clostridium sp.]|nr:hypothetical protein [Clostridium sp.]